ncbi:hypothetical protein GCM10015535_36950 [Streptomyces gelaticus]|uniref:Uncharacterized protein n=1 Tax=Streptomyces gelaticus TaxID=285446 RepID=A0ABQ2W0I5_9ACTN|nr:hypothetical protein GCM10015535_36950 [Streptomyces gelaticus]
MSVLFGLKAWAEAQGFVRKLKGPRKLKDSYVGSRNQRPSAPIGQAAAKAHSDEASHSGPHKLILGNGTDRCPVVCPAS